MSESVCEASVLHLPLGLPNVVLSFGMTTPGLVRKLGEHLEVVMEDGNSSSSSFFQLLVGVRVCHWDQGNKHILQIHIYIYI